MSQFRSFGIAAALLLAAATATSATAQTPPSTTGTAEKPTTGKVGEKMPGFKAKVVRGDKTQDFDSTKTETTTFYFLVGVECPATKPYVDRLCALEAAYMPKGVDFVYVYVNVPEKPAVKAKFHKQSKFAGGFLNDEKSEIAKMLAATKTGEVLIAGKDGTVLYRGGVDDSPSDAARAKVKYVQDALNEILAGKPVTTPTSKVHG
jgi:hypothetical protein